MEQSNLNFEVFMQDFDDRIFVLGNHHNYGMFRETYEERGNELLRESNIFLNQWGNLLENNRKCEIKCKQYWIAGFLSGQNYKISDENKISHIF